MADTPEDGKDRGESESVGQEPEAPGPTGSSPPVTPPEAGDSERPRDHFQRIQDPSDLLPAVSFDGEPDSGGSRPSQRSDDIRPGATAAQIERVAKGVVVHQRGEVIDERYVLVKPIDEGGMGIVWLAHSRALEVDVAVKLTQAWRRGVVAHKRMEREARTVAKLNHPAVVRIYDFGRTSRGDPYIAMELLQGRSLGRQLDSRGPLSPEKAIQLLLPIVDAIATAHEAGIVHRDLKPDNIFISQVSDRIYPKLLDFSLVKLVTPDLSNASLTVDRRGVGTAPYLSPEQVQGLDDVDQRADIWALCAVLYRATTGKAPFDGVSRYDVIQAVVEKEPVPTHQLDVGDRAFWRIIERGLRKDREQRYATARELGQDLAAWLVERGVHEDVGNVSLGRMWLDEPEPQPAASRWRGLARTPRVALALGAGVVVGVVLTSLLRGSTPEPSAAPPEPSAAGADRSDVGAGPRASASGAAPAASASAQGSSRSRRGPKSP